jgi:signal peptidase I
MARLTFGRTKKRVNYDLLQIILKWTFEIALVCFIAFVFVWFFRVCRLGKDSIRPMPLTKAHSVFIMKEQR